MKPASAVVLLFASSILPLSLPAATARFGEATPLEWSIRMAESELARRGSSLEFGGSSQAGWDYTTALFAVSLQELGAFTGRAEFVNAGSRMVESFVAPDGTIRTYREDEYNLDSIAGGRPLLTRYASRAEPPLKAGAAALRAQLAKQPRTSEGGFWHKQRYPQQMWLDGLYMAAPFYARYGRLMGEAEAFDDVAKQIRLLDEHLYDSRTGLLYHAWDETRKQAWADKKTGRSPHFWGRAVGWYVMALVDVLDELPTQHPEAKGIRERLGRTAEGIARWQHPATGVWWQIMDQGGRPGNYLEASASSMFVYALAKGVNRGYLSRERFLPVVERGYAGLIDQFARKDGDSAISLTRCCEVAGLGYTNKAGRARDGSFEYYISEPIVDNDLKGVGPFILAGIEVQKLLAGGSENPWAQMDAILSRIKDPEFAPREFVITDHGAKPGADASEAIRTAISACASEGGGRVVIPPGEWKTGPIRLRSRVNLHVSEGATLVFSTKPADYPRVYTRWEGVECMNFSPLIYAFEEDTIAITGKGTLDGGASLENWWGWTKKGSVRKDRESRNLLFEMGEKGVPVEERIFGEGHYLRPSFIQTYRCRNVLIEGVKVIRSPFWEIHPVLSSNVTVRGVHIKSHGPNNDGCDPESCRDVLIEDCVFDTGDDCIAIKSGRNNDGRRVNVPSDGIVVRRCTMKDGHGGVVLGSEISGGGRNVFVEDCVMDSPELDRALRLKSNARRGGTIENIFMRRVKVGRVAEAVLTIDLQYEEGAKGDFPPHVRNILLEEVTSDASPRAVWIAGLPAATVEDVRLVRCQIRGVTEPERIEHAGQVVFASTSLVPAGKVRSRNSPQASISAAGAASPAKDGTKKVRLVLVGDSTVNDESGWGVAFKRLLGPEVECINAALNGRSSKSFRDEGHWERALAWKGDYYLIQFGHNDQPGKGPKRETDPNTTFAENLARYVDEVRGAGGRPILVTSLTRREFDPAGTGKIKGPLEPYVAATRKVAAQKGVPLLDLNARSVAYCERIGPEKSDEFNPPKESGVDRTHLNAAGQLVFARMVAEELRTLAPELADSISIDPRP